MAREARSLLSSKFHHPWGVRSSAIVPALYLRNDERQSIYIRSASSTTMQGRNCFDIPQQLPNQNSKTLPWTCRSRRLAMESRWISRRRFHAWHRLGQASPPFHCILEPLTLKYLRQEFVESMVQVPNSNISLFTNRVISIDLPGWWVQCHKHSRGPSNLFAISQGQSIFGAPPALSPLWIDIQVHLGIGRTSRRVFFTMLVRQRTVAWLGIWAIFAYRK